MPRPPPLPALVPVGPKRKYMNASDHRFRRVSETGQGGSGGKLRVRPRLGPARLQVSPFSGVGRVSGSRNQGQKGLKGVPLGYFASASFASSPGASQGAPLKVRLGLQHLKCCKHTHTHTQSWNSWAQDRPHCLSARSSFEPEPLIGGSAVDTAPAQPMAASRPAAAYAWTL